MRGAALLLASSLVACSPTEPAPATTCEAVEVIVAASNYESSLVCGAPGCTDGAHSRGVDLGTDPQLVATGGRALLLARDRDLVFELDPRCGRPAARFSVAELGEGRLANPHDAAAAPDGALFVALFGVPKVAVLRDGRPDGAPIDLSAYDDDGNPDAESIRIVDVGGAPKAFVTLERLGWDGARLVSNKPSQMLRIDVTSRAVEAVVDLVGRNPFNRMAEHGGALFLAEPRDFDAADEELAGIERFDTATSTSRIIVSERALGGSVAEVAVTDGCAVAVVAGPEPNLNPTSVVAFDPDDGAVRQTVLGPTPGYDLQGLAWRGATLYVGDRRRGPGGYPIHVFERTDDRCGLRPVDRDLALPAPPVALRAAR